MKTTNLIFGLGLLGALPAIATTGGGIDGSGGNPTGSTAVEVRFSMTHLKENLDRVFRRLDFPATPIAPAVKPLIETLLPSPTSGKENVFEDIRASKYVLKENDPCVDQDGKPSAAAAVVSQLGGAICFSLPELMKISPDALPFQLAALAAHEHLHHFGGTEDQAVALQDYLLREGRTQAFGAAWVTQLSASVDRLTANTRALSEYLGRTPTASPLLVCREIGKLNGLDQNLYLADPFASEVPADVNGEILDVSVANSNLQAICDGAHAFSIEGVKSLLEPFDIAQRKLWLSLVGW